jgi:sulfide:quinone oxidoreductase
MKTCPGLGPDQGHTQWIGTVDEAEPAYADFRKLLANPGPVVIGAVQFASCFGPAYEYAAILDTALRRHRVRDRVPITFVTSEPYLGHLGIAGVGDSKGMMEHEFRNRHIKWIANARVSKIEPGKLFAEELDAKGQLAQQHEIAFAHAMMVPAFKGVAAVAAVEGLVNPRGLVIVDEHQRSHERIRTSTRPARASPSRRSRSRRCRPVQPKTGYMIESMVSAVVSNITPELSGQSPASRRRPGMRSASRISAIPARCSSPSHKCRRAM